MQEVYKKVKKRYVNLWTHATKQGYKRYLHGHDKEGELTKTKIYKKI